ncbi:cobalt-precorrin-5B (C(1))-methyltransferase [Arachnia propionica]|uniref:cobalt-precorrin-5B (C(1))-methyltransferase n=1 Tax=Arachnia propionica TaxID=1750 RepID=UPI003C6C08C2
MCVTVSIDDGARIAEKTWNSRIGVLGGLSVLGTTGVVVPYSCSAWIASIHRGIDVAIATGATHAAACTGSTSERVAEELYPGIELLDMGDFAGAVLKYLRKHPLPRLAIVGGVAKLSKLAAGYLDLHSHRTRIQPGHLRQLVEGAGASPELADAIGEVATVAHAVTLAGEVGIDLPQLIADSARDEALAVLGGAPVEVEIVVIDRAGKILARAH